GEVAFLFGPADYCALMLVGFVCVSFVTTGSLLNGMAMCLIGVLLGQIGTDVTSGMQRFTMNLDFLIDGIGLVSIALGCFGIAEITKNLDNRDERTPFNGKINLIPTWPEFKRIIPSALRGSAIGSFIGIPENAVMALMMAAFIIKGIQPGPNMIAGHPDLFWGLVASMWIGNCFLLILNVPMVRYWLSVFKIPYGVLFPSILFFCCIGTFSVNNNLSDIYTTATFG